jgi:two-component system, cell cycle sensor histidine kinase and response regulator CckA
LRLLIVDDHAEYRATAVRLLAMLGHEVIEADGPDTAEAALAREGDGIEVVLLDLFLGADDGVTVAQRLAARRPGLRILFMSGHDEATFAPAELEAPGRRFIEKPFSLPALEAALADLAGQSAARAKV